MPRRRPAPSRRESPPGLPVLPADDPCRGCGACCLHVGWPPFFRARDPRWERLVRKRSDLVEEIKQAESRFGASGGWKRVKGMNPEIPCVWYDHATRRCRHYELRPDACREFEPGEGDCLRFRTRHGVKPTFRTSRANFSTQVLVAIEISVPICASEREKPVCHNPLEGRRFR